MRRWHSNKEKEMKNKYGLATAIVALGLAQICGAALIAEWNFDDSGNLGNDSAGAFDLTTTSGQTVPTYDAAGRVGGAASFVSGSEFVTPANIYPDGDLTIAGWFRPSATTFVNAHRPYSNRGGIQLYASGGSWRWRANKQDNTYVYRVGPAVVADEWVHIALWYNATSGPDANGNYTGAVRLWVDGVNLGGLNDVEMALPDSYVMHLGDKWGDYLGLMDEVKVYNHALSGTEIEALAAVPEPATFTLFGLASAGVLLVRRRFLV